jgi:signal transduction histidine kinase/HAMP domain-containing protein
VLASIRSQILAAFLLLSIIIAGIGIYSAIGIWTDAKIVREMYDKPLMAVNLARSANLVFSDITSKILQQRLGGAQADVQDKIDAEIQDFFDDLQIAQERSLSKDSLGLITGIAISAHRWNELRLAGRVTPKAESDAAMDALSADIIAKFDALNESALLDGFRERERASNAIRRQLAISVATTTIAFFFSTVVAVLLAQRILKPLSDAARIANRVAGGDFLTEIPEGGAGETGLLLRSMAAMQANIRAMMEREAAQRRSAQMRLVDAVEGSEEGMLLLDARERIVVVNSQTRRLFPSIAEQLAPEAVFAPIFAAAEERPETVADMQSWLQLFNSSGEVELAHGRWLRISQSTTQEGGRLLFLTDITELKEREASLTAARAAAEAASIAKTQFLANVSHELRTPLNAVIGFSDIIANEQFGAVGNALYKEYACDIGNGGRHLLSIINNVLDLANSADGTLKLNFDRVDLRDVIDDCARIVAQDCEAAGVTLDTKHAAEACIVLGDESKLRQILRNLLSNAVKFSSEGRAVSVSAHPVAADLIELVVADNGIGMAQEDIQTALEPFGQVDSQLARKYAGAGLGLPLAKALTDLHGGRLEIDSVLGEGTTVRIFLPTAQAPTAQALTAQA